MPKVTGPLFSLKAWGQFGKRIIFKRGGIVVNYFKPRNPNSAAQQAQREAFKELYVAGLTQEQADLLYAAILHYHDERYAPLNHVHELPIGFVWISTVSTNPATLLGYGTWTAIAAGRMLVGYDAGDSDFNASKKTGGEKTHTLTTSEMPSHTHTQDAHNHSVGVGYNGASDGALRASGELNQGVGYIGGSFNAGNATATNQNTGGGEAHNNMPPFYSVYMFERTA